MSGHRLLMGGLALSASLLCLSNVQPAYAQQPGQSFPMGDVQLLESRWLGNQERTLNYLHFVDVDRLLYVFRANHGLDTQGAEATGGWESPDFPFRSHSQGHFLSAWSHCWASTRSEDCRDRAAYMVGELARCQANNAAAGFEPGYLAGFPESEIEKVENRTLSNGNVPYYAIHKTMAGLLDVWRHMGNGAARDVLVGMADWADTRTGRLSPRQQQDMLDTEYGGMADVLAELAAASGERRYMDVARRFDHARVFDPAAAGVDALRGLHANTQAQKFAGAVHEYGASGEERYLDIARNAFGFVVHNHSYAIGGNSQAEHWHEPGDVTGHLREDTCETCNTYNMLKVARGLWAAEDAPEAHYFDYYERALLNHLLGAQHPGSEHGHITYFTPLNPGGRRGVGPAWGGGTWSTDYDSFWCCQGTSLETNTKLMDSIYWRRGDALYVNLYIPSRLSWDDKGVAVTQRTGIPVADDTTFEIEGSGRFDLALRIPEWAGPGVELLVNGEPISGDVAAEPGSYAMVSGREWRDGDVVSLRLPMSLRQIPATDDDSVVAFAYGPSVLAGNYGNRGLGGMPRIDAESVRRLDGEQVAFEAVADGETVVLSAFYDAHDYNYNVYWRL